MTQFKDTLETKNGKTKRACYINGQKVTPESYDKKLKEAMYANQVTSVLNKASQEIWFKY